MLLALLLALQAATPPPDLRISGSAGWGGRAVPGEPTPVLVDLDSSASLDRPLTLRLAWAAPPESQAGDAPRAEALGGRSGAVSLVDVLLPARSRRRLSLSFPAPERGRFSLWVHALDAKGRGVAFAALPVQLVPPGQRLLGVVGRSPLADLGKAALEPGRLLPDELPEDSAGYLGLHALLWIDGKADELRSPRQADALAEWVRSGGRLVVSRASMAGFGGSPIADLLPVTPASAREFLLLDGLRPVAPPPDGRVVVLASTLKRGRLLLEQEEVPLAVEARMGAGRVTFLAFDVSREPFSGWSEAPRLWTWLFGEAPPVPPQELLAVRAPPTIGSLALTARAVEFPDVEPPKVQGLFLMIVLYVAVVGPFDYLLLRVLGRHEWTWFTFPLYVAGFTALILGSGGAFIRRAAYQRELAVVDYHASGSRTRAISALLAPADGDFGLAQGAEPVCTAYLANRAHEDVMEQLKDARVRRGDGRARTEWQIGRLQSALAMLDAAGPAGPPPLTFKTEGSGDKFRLRVSNRGPAYATAFLATDSGVYFLGPIEPGDQVLEADRNYSSIDAFVQTHAPAAAAAAFDENARRALVALSFQQPPRPGQELIVGLARRLDARTFVESGGHLLLAWPRTSTRSITHDPEPTRRSSVLLHRYFQEPGP